MPKTPSDSPPEHSQPSRPGRLRSAWRVLRGRALVPEQIEWEWLEYKLQFNALLDRYSALLARDAKRLKREEEGASQRQPLSGSRSVLPRHQLKAELGSRVLGRSTLQLHHRDPQPSLPLEAEEETA